MMRTFCQPLFNCQAWSKLLEPEFKKLSVIQLKFLKKVFMAPRSTPNAAVLLELGILLIKEEVNKRGFGFLHHILNLGPEDPVQKMLMIQKEFEFKKNWANDILECLKHYEIDFTLDEIRSMNKDHWKVEVKKKLKKIAFDILQREAGGTESTSQAKQNKMFVCENPGGQKKVHQAGRELIFFPTFQNIHTN